MKYMLLIYDDPKVWGALSQDEQNQLMGEYFKFTEEIKASGHYISGDPLHPAAAATSVRVREGKPLLTDGPFAETREELGGYYLVKAKDLDEAVGIAAKVPSSRLGTIEVRPVVEFNAQARA